MPIAQLCLMIMLTATELFLIVTPTKKIKIIAQLAVFQAVEVLLRIAERLIHTLPLYVP